MANTLLSILLVIRVLCIGNSFSWDAVEQELVPLCAEKGVEVEIHNLYYGGCSLQQHVEFMHKNKPVYGHRVCTNVEPRIVKDTITLRQALRDGKYDYISLQQASHDSGIRSSYEPWLSILIDSVRAYQPAAQLCWMQTWAYSQDAKHPAYPRYHNNQQEMWDSIVACTQYVMDTANYQLSTVNSQLLLIPCGAAIQYARATKLGDTLCRDGYHLNYEYGRYTAACVWYEVLTGMDVRRNKYMNGQMSYSQRCYTQCAAHRAVKEYKR
ncbi:MAG: DUF4886 domain-containing protein [Paludibacteraceae bacterium]|nr:DUF4886 domain-containing protein [Paludibacteraceae bacterium]